MRLKTRIGNITSIFQERAEFKTLGDSGEFEGYAGVFGNVDDGKDRIIAGAVKQIFKLQNGKTPTLFMHSPRDPIGLAEISQDTKGIAFRSQLELGDPTARRAHTLMKSGLLDGMSIGFDTLPEGALYQKDGVRDLVAIKLWEISPVTFGMNPLARIDAVKEAGNISTIREFESFLRDVGGFDKARAKALALGGWDALLKVRDEPAGDPGAAIAGLLETRLFQQS